MSVVDYFLKIDGIDGESPDKKHPGEIEIDSMSFGAVQHGTAARGGGSGAGKVSFSDFHFSKHVDKASPKLFLACASGEHLKKMTLTCRKAGKEQQEYLKVVMEDCLVSSYSVGGSGHGGALPADSISINMSSCDFDYKEQKADGTLGGSVKAGWSVKTNAKL